MPYRGWYTDQVMGKLGNVNPAALENYKPGGGACNGSDSIAAKPRQGDALLFYNQ